MHVRHTLPLVAALLVTVAAPAAQDTRPRPPAETGESDRQPGKPSGERSEERAERNVKESFSASLGVNGHVYRFTDREAYEAARKAAMEDAPELGELLEKGIRESDARTGSSTFRGAFDIDGEKIEFDSEAELRDALRKRGLTLPFAGGLDDAMRKCGRSVFSGSLGVNGKSYRFDDRAAFEAAREALRTGSPDLAKLLERAKPGDGTAKAFSGSIDVNGEKLDFSDEAAFRKALEARGLKDLFERLGASGGGARSFSGSLQVDGKSYRFDDRDAFEAAREALRAGSPELEKLLEKARRAEGPARVFKGSIHVDGETREFDDEAEYRKALEALRSSRKASSDRSHDSGEPESR